MAGTAVVDETTEGQLPELSVSDSLGGDAPGEDTPLKTRLVLPILVPLLSVAIVAALVLDLSRVFLADDKNTALAIAIAITLSILIGASIIAAFPRLKTSSLAVVLGCVLLLVSLAGLVSLGSSTNDGASAGASFVNPPGPATSAVSVSAGSRYTFNGVAFEGQYTAKAGIVQISYGGASGHTLAIQTDPRYTGFLLNSASKPQTGKVRLTPGKYTIYCTVPGHEALGMKATITVK